MATGQVSAVERMFNLISWDDSYKLEAVVDSLVELESKHPEALQRFLEIFLSQACWSKSRNIVWVGRCNLCSSDIGFQLVNDKLVYRCDDPRCDNHIV